MEETDSNLFMPIHWAAWEGHTKIAQHLASKMRLEILQTATTKVNWSDQEFRVCCVFFFNLEGGCWN
jgi:ankyrin repeat protein